MAPRAHVLDHGVRRSGQGRLLVGGTPARRLRLTAAGSRALDRLLAGEGAAGAESLRERLTGHGLLHPLARPSSVPVTFVIPVRNGGAGLVSLVARLREWGPVIVVDDGSDDGSGERAAAAGARTIVNRGVGGPAAARNLGLAAARTEFVAFVDADCSCPRDWARPLAGLLAEDPGLALAAPRVRGGAGSGAIAGYERWRSPLDMGAHQALVGPGRRVAYVPSAALVARRATLLGLGGFEESLRFGEDVDLCWRAAAAGWTVRYAPELEIEHQPRPTLAAFARQRFEYGSSAAALDRRHPGAVAPLRLNRGTALVLAGALAGPRALALAAVAQVARAACRDRDPASAAPLALIATEGLLSSGRTLSRALSRDWLPLTLLALAKRRTRPYAATALAADLATQAKQNPGLLLPTSVLLRVAENTAYAAGLWRGAFEHRSPRALLPGAGFLKAFEIGNQVRATPGKARLRVRTGGLGVSDERHAAEDQD